MFHWQFDDSKVRPISREPQFFNTIEDVDESTLQFRSQKAKASTPNPSEDDDTSPTSMQETTSSASQPLDEDDASTATTAPAPIPVAGNSEFLRSLLHFNVTRSLNRTKRIAADWLWSRAGRQDSVLLYKSVISLWSWSQDKAVTRIVEARTALSDLQPNKTYPRGLAALLHACSLTRYPETLTVNLEDHVRQGLSELNDMFLHQPAVFRSLRVSHLLEPLLSMCANASLSPMALHVAETMASWGIPLTSPALASLRTSCEHTYDLNSLIDLSWVAPYDLHATRESRLSPLLISMLPAGARDRDSPDATRVLEQIVNVARMRKECGRWKRMKTELETQVLHAPFIQMKDMSTSSLLDAFACAGEREGLEGAMAAKHITTLRTDTFHILIIALLGLSGSAQALETYRSFKHAGVLVSPKG